jgi:hypothetical protein
MQDHRNKRGELFHLSRRIFSMDELLFCACNSEEPRVERVSQLLAQGAKPASHVNEYVAYLATVNSFLMAPASYSGMDGRRSSRLLDGATSAFCSCSSTSTSRRRALSLNSSMRSTATGTLPSCTQAHTGTCPPCACCSTPGARTSRPCASRSWTRKTSAPSILKCS